MVDELPIIEPLRVAHALSFEWEPVFAEPATVPVARSLEAFMSCAPLIEWPPQPVYTSREVANLLSRCPASAPGPDGIHYLHLACLGPTVADYLAELANLWIERGLWSADFKHAFLVPLPKSQDELWTPAPTRPISLANTSGKILMRLLSGTLYSSLSSVIVQSQRGFLPGRQIAECIVQLEAACLACAPTHPGAAAIFLDNSKAFDLDLAFLFALVHRTRAPEWLVRALRAAYLDTSVAFMVQGVQGPSIRTARALRQGCPASAILLVFCMDPILRWLERISHPSPTVIGYADEAEF